ncbi:helix-turn-helix domain-containing protein [Bacillus sp. ISL-18]|uniref:GH39 family glycosyl hydrolase n=1 Tax=Bacillus sp. ISL-18 TaxID=2819118 RepID=UPI001BEC64CA|nr:helix-turn-helix domain-containing protein [Bacillus sp. ISL-18]MBT2654025.1 helix-turn-helix domain-containing protein [Bacillus sp. ISL-18]
MNFTYEIIEMNKELPLHIFLNSVDYVSNHWHDSIEIIFVLKGKVNVSVNDKRFELNEKDVVLINANDIHAIQHQDENLLLTIQLPIPDLKEHIKDVDSYVFSCKSFLYDEHHQAEFNELRSMLAQMMWVINKESEGYELQIKSLYFQLIYLLMKNFKEETEKESKLSSQKHIERLLRITSYVKDNFKQQITLNELSQIEFLSVHYLSKFIQKHLGMPFSKYVDSIRLDHAVKDIVFTDIPLTQIALDNGFASVKAFNRAFKEFYQQTPSEYRRAVEMEPKKTESNKVTLANYVEIDKTQAFDQLFAFLPSKEQSLVVENKAVLKKTIKINVEEKADKLNHTWKNLMTVGKAKECLYTDIQNQIKQVKKATNFKYLRFHGIFDDEMMVYGENEQGIPEYNFLYTDKLIEFLRSIHVKPFVELGFMPSELAASHETVFYKESNVSKPKDIEKWNNLLMAFILRYENLYGQDEVLQWYFEVWNEPDFYVFWRGTFEEYCLLYKNTYETIKGINPLYKVGGPSIVSINNSDWLQQFLDFCKRENCIPDFISFHNYSHDEMDINKKKNLTNDQAMESGYISRDEHFLKNRIAVLKRKLAENHLNDIEVHLTEWNSTAYHRDLTNDTSFKAAFIVKNLVENIDAIQSFGYWTLTDLIEERRASTNSFHGGLGLITNNNIPKPAFFAYQLLGKLGNQLVSQGDGYILTKNSKGYQLLLYHYCHYDRLYCMNQHANIDLENRYNVFLNQNPIEMKFIMNELKKGTYKVRQYQLNRQHGSSFDQWVEMGAPELMNQEDIDYLIHSSIPKLQISEVRIEEDYILSTILGAHEVQLFEIVPQRTL